jgi:hypothetical protein
MATVELALIVPAYNPQPGWSEQLLEQWNRFKAAMPYSTYCLVLTNDGSTTPHFEEELQTLQEKEPFLVTVNETENKGKGAALRNAIRTINANHYLLTDVDLPYTTESMLAVAQAVSAATDIAAGNRDPGYYKKVPFVRSLLSQGLRYLIRKRLQLPFDDTQCGLKAINEKGKQLFLQTKTERYLYDLEFIMKAAADPKYNIKPVPVKLRDGIIMRRMSGRILIQEASNFLKIIIYRTRL